jgi:hypothetical protein
MPLEINHPVGCKKTGDIKEKPGFIRCHGQDVTDRGEAVKRR